MSNQTRRQPDYLITARRKDQDARMLMSKTAKEYSTLKQKSHFEESTQLRINHNNQLKRYRDLKRRDDEILDARREKYERVYLFRLRILFKEDEKQYRSMLLASEVSADDRLDQMRKRVGELKKIREKDRKAVVEEKLEQQWRYLGNIYIRLNCDELRQVESRLRVKKVAEERSAQLEELVVRKQAEQKEKEYYEGLWEQERQKKIEREIQDFNQAQERNNMQMVVLKEQLQLFKEQALKHEKLKYEEARLMRLDAELRVLEDQRARERKVREAKQVALDLDKFNKIRIKQRQKEIQDALDTDIRILAEVSKLEELERSTNARRRVELAKEMNIYRKHLEDQKLLEIEREKELEKVYAHEQDRIWEIRTQKWRKEQAARDKLMQEVLDGRKLQLKEALERNHQEQEETRLLKLEIERQAEVAKIQDNLKQENIRKKREKYSTELKAQIKDVERLRVLEHEAEERIIAKEKARLFISNNLG